MTGQVQLQVDGRLARVTLAHSGRMNAMSREMWRELKQVAESLQARADLRCVIVCGEGGHFCAGGDIAEYPAFRFDEAKLREFHEETVWGALQALLDCDLPLIAQIEGNCMGAGVEIAACCDIRIAGQGAKFGAPIARLGFPMAPREAQLVAGAAGLLTAREMLLEAAVLDAPTLLARGFVNAVVPDADVAQEVLRRAHRIDKLAPKAARLNKQTLRALSAAPAQGGNGSAALEAWMAVAYAYAESAEHREGIHAFLDKRQPDF